MISDRLRIGLYGVAFAQQAALLAQPLLTGLLEAGVEVTLIDPPVAPTSLRHPKLQHSKLGTARKLVDSLYVGQLELVKAAQATGLPVVLDLSEQLFNAVIPTATGYLMPLKNPAWASAQIARPVISLCKLPRTVIATDPPLQIVSVMPLEWASGLEFAIDAVAQVIRLGVPLQYTIVGAGSYEDALIYAARLWGLWQTGQIHFQPPERASSALDIADLMLHVPYIGRFEPVVLEALGRGLPMIVSDTPPLQQMVGTAAYSVSRRQPDALRDMILRLVTQPNERLQLANAAISQAATWENTDTEGWITAYRQALTTQVKASNRRIQPPSLTII